LPQGPVPRARMVTVSRLPSLSDRQCQVRSIPRLLAARRDTTSPRHESRCAAPFARSRGKHARSRTRPPATGAHLDDQAQFVILRLGAAPQSWPVRDGAGPRFPSPAGLWRQAALLARLVLRSRRPPILPFMSCQDQLLRVKGDGHAPSRRSEGNPPCRGPAQCVWTNPPRGDIRLALLAPPSSHPRQVTVRDPGDHHDSVRRPGSRLPRPRIGLQQPWTA
jgi:hypothetical protein